MAEMMKALTVAVEGYVMTKEHVDCLVWVHVSENMLSPIELKIVKTFSNSSSTLGVVSNKSDEKIVDVSCNLVHWAKPVKNEKDEKLIESIKISSKIKLENGSTIYSYQSNNVIDTNQKETVDSEEFCIEDIFEKGIIVKRFTDGRLFFTSPKLIVEVIESLPQSRLRQIGD